MRRRPGIRFVTLTKQLEAAVAQGTSEALSAVLANGRDAESTSKFASLWLAPGATRVVVKERERVDLSQGGQRLVLEALIESGSQARLGTWQMDVRQESGVWRIFAVKTLGSMEGLYRLELDSKRQYEAANLRVTAEDFELVLPQGHVYVANVGAGTTAVVVMGRGEMIFTPASDVERGQVKLYAGNPTLRTPFDVAFVRLNPGQFDARFTTQALTPTPVDPRHLRVAQEIFRDSVGNAFGVDLADLSPEVWSLVPSSGDFLAEVRTRRFGTLTYTRASSEPEDISLFNRSRRRNVSVYASKARLDSRGPFFHEDDDQPFDVLDYNVDTSLVPERQWFDARARLRVRVRAEGGAFSMNLKLASTLTVRSVTSESGPLLLLRVRNQDSLVVNLPGVVPHDGQFTLTISYSGRVTPQSLEQEVIGAPNRGPSCTDDRAIATPESSLLYSNRSYWYPQTSVGDYATASIRVTLPPRTRPLHGRPGQRLAGDHQDAAGEPRALFVFAAAQPVRYLACAVSRIVPIESGFCRSSIVPERRLHRRPAPATPNCGSRHTRPHGSAAVHANCSIAPRRSPRCTRASCTISRIPASPSPCSRATCPAGTAPPISRLSTSRCRRRRSRGATIRRASTNYPGVLPGARARAPVVGPGRGMEELPRAVAQRGLRAVLRRALRGAASAAPDVFDGSSAQMRALGGRHVRPGPRLSRIPPRPHQERTAASSARWSTTRARWCCTCCGGWWATTCSSGRSAASTPTYRFKKAGTDDLRGVRAESGVRCRVLRSLDLRLRPARAR